jgi:two-component system KDP operon response regulator KdpE
MDTDLKSHGNKGVTPSRALQANAERGDARHEASEPATILVVDGDPNGRTLLVFTLRQRGYRCAQASNGADGIAAVVDRRPGVVLLDLDLPDLKGEEVTRRIREESRVPIIVVSARGQEEGRVDALDAGANDFVTKPFSSAELFARVHIALRAVRTAEPEPDTGVVTIGDLRVNFDNRSLTVSGTEVYLTRTEYRLLSLLVRSSGRVVTSRQILRQVWGTHYEEQTGYLRIYMQKLRSKVEREPAHPKYLITQRGVGYCLRLPC